jgi:beta-lactamase regulating signal transducer with metallopeptidase domain
MALYLFKSAICLFVLLLFYRLVLQRAAMYQVNRFFLIFSVLVSFVIPFIPIEVSATEEVSTYMVTAGKAGFSTDREIASNMIIVENSLDWTLIIWGIYFLFTSLLLFRLIKNLSRLLLKIKHNQLVRYRDQNLIMLKDNCAPYSFLNYIFVSQSDFEKGKITDSILIHESTHVREKHSWDNLLIEFLLVFLWFHPVLYWAKTAIKLNHEFIADQAALKIIPVEEYKIALFSMILSGHAISFTSSLNFSLTKKRIAMMKNKPTEKLKWATLFSILPLLAGLTYFLSEKVIAQVPKEKGTFVFYGSAGERESDLQLFLSANGLVHFLDEAYQASEIGAVIKSKSQKDIGLVKIVVAPGTPMGYIGDLQSEFRELGISINFVQTDQQPTQSEQPKASDKYFYYSQTTFFIEDKSGNRIKKSFNQLTDVQRAGLPEPPTIPVKTITKPETFSTWKDAKQFAVWVDGVNVPNQKLEEMEASQIVYSFTSFVHDNARSLRFPQPYQVQLYTEKGFSKTYGPESDFATKPLGGWTTIR